MVIVSKKTTMIDFILFFPGNYSSISPSSTEDTETASLKF